MPSNIAASCYFPISTVIWLPSQLFIQDIVRGSFGCIFRHYIGYLRFHRFLPPAPVSAQSKNRS